MPMKPKTPKVTSRKYEGDDLASWAIFVDGCPVMTGLTRPELPYYRAQVKEMIKEGKFS